MRISSRSFLSLASLLALGLVAVAAPPPSDLWKLGPIAPGELPARVAAVDQGAIAVPAVVRPTCEFQKILVRITAGVPLAEWLPDVEKFAKTGGDDPVAKALRELALFWEARARMQQIDKALRQYYRDAVRYPERLEEVRSVIPADAKTDPWGETWVYKTAAPEGFANLAQQRYQLGPARDPKLSTVEQFVHGVPAPRPWKMTGRDIGGTKALEIRTGDGKAAVVQPGGKIADVTVAFVGDGWALFADTERLFALPFQP